MTSIEYPNFFKLCREWTDFFYSPKMEKIIGDIVVAEPFYPSQENIFKCFYMTPYNDIKVIILGQDPYHDGAATGLCFEVIKEKLLNPSLRNIYKELENEGYYPTKDGCLESWAKQGVLLLNSALTVAVGDPGSHLEQWSIFFENVLKEIGKLNNIVWIVFGQKARAYINLIPKGNGHVIFETSHPSPFSAMKSSSTQEAFMGSGIFKKVNTQLQKYGKDKIIW
jgi:uracil-DNA glycosylase